MSSSTILFYLGTRPVFAPEEMHRAPVSVMLLGPTLSSGDHIWSGNIAYSYNSATLQFNLYGSKNYSEDLRWIENNVLVFFVQSK